MSKSFTDELTEPKRESRNQKLTAFLARGAEVWPPFLEEFEDDMTFGKTAAAKDAAMGALAGTATRLAANYAAAVARDAKYAHAGRVFMLKQGHHNAFRELYEGAKIAVDNGDMWEGDEDA